MKSSFIQKYAISIAETIMGVVAGCLLMYIMQTDIMVILKILICVVLFAVLLAVDGYICWFSDKNYVQKQGMLQESNKAVEIQRQISNPLDDVPVRAQKKEDQSSNKINEIALIGEQGNILLEWSLVGKTCLVIGKGTEKEAVDIDLTETAMGQLVSKQHAVLNYTDNGWYIDDIDSKNGTRVKKRNQSALLDVKLVGAVEVEAGDIIYIANTMLQLR